MVKKSILGCSLALLTLALLMPLQAGAPTKLSEVAPVEDLVAEANAKLEELSEYLTDKDAYLGSKKNSLPRAAGVLACIAQAIAEHENNSKVDVNGADLRDAALTITKSESYEQASAALEQAQKAAAGKSNGSASGDYAWDELIDTHHLMEEVNARNAQLRRVLRRPKDPQEDSLHATTLAVLALAIQADTHEVKDKSDIPEWEGYAGDFRKSMTKLATALKEEDSQNGRKLWIEGARTCNACHKKFREE